MEVLYLTHQTQLDHLPALLMSGQLMSRLDAYRNRGLHLPTGFSTSDLEELKNPKDLKIGDGEYPGVYFQAIWKQHAGLPIELGHEQDTATLVFCQTLLERDDYHYNILDSNGHLNNLTYSKGFWRQLAPDQVDLMNEVVFHHPVSLLFLRSIWVPTLADKLWVEQQLTKYWGHATYPHDFVQVRSTYKNQAYKCPSKMIYKLLGNWCFFPDIYKRRGNTQSLAIAKQVAENCGMSKASLDGIDNLEELSRRVYPYVQSAFLKQVPRKQIPPPWKDTRS